MPWVESNVCSRVSKHNTLRTSPHCLEKLHLGDARLQDSTLTVSWAKDAIWIHEQSTEAYRENQRERGACKIG